MRLEQPDIPAPPRTLPPQSGVRFNKLPERDDEYIQ
jgi:hypothetical protein